MSSGWTSGRLDGWIEDLDYPRRLIAAIGSGRYSCLDRSILGVHACDRLLDIRRQAREMGDRGTAVDDLLRVMLESTARDLEESALTAPYPDIRRYQKAAEYWNEAASYKNGAERDELLERAEECSRLFSQPIERWPRDRRRAATLAHHAARIRLIEANADEAYGVTPRSEARNNSNTREENCQRVAIATDAAIKTDQLVPAPARTSQDLSAKRARLVELHEWGYGSRYEPVTWEQIPASIMKGGLSATALIDIDRKSQVGHVQNLVMIDGIPAVLDGQDGSLADIEDAPLTRDRNEHFAVILTRKDNRVLNIDDDALCDELLEIMESDAFSTTESEWGMQRLALVTTYHFQEVMSYMNGGVRLFVPNTAPPAVRDLPPCPRAVQRALDEFAEKRMNSGDFGSQIETSRKIGNAASATLPNGDIDLDALSQFTNSTCAISEQLAEAVGAPGASMSDAVAKAAWLLDDDGAMVVVTPGRPGARYISRIDGYVTTYDTITRKLTAGTPTDFTARSVVVEVAGNQKLLDREPEAPQVPLLFSMLPDESRDLPTTFDLF